MRAKHGGQRSFTSIQRTFVEHARDFSMLMYPAWEVDGREGNTLLFSLEQKVGENNQCPVYSE